MTTSQSGDHSDTAEAAGFWIRAAARFFDWLVMLVVGFLVAFVLVIIAGVVEGLTGRSADAFVASLGKTTWIGWIGSTLAMLGYPISFEGIAGSTVGKRMIGLQVLSTALEPINFLQGTKRSVAFLIDALFFGMVAASLMNDSPEKRRVGDQWAETRVVRRRSIPPSLRASTPRMLAALIAALITAGMLTAITHVLESLWLLRA
jgi:uncharacterized RDD family membrane protein YckC